MKVEFSNINYIANGNALNQTTLNKPSASLELRTNELRRATLTNEVEKSIIDSLVYSVHSGDITSPIPNSDWRIKVNCHLDTYSAQGINKEVSYSVALSMDNYDQTFINIGSSKYNSAKYTIKHSDFSSLFGGYSSAYRGSRLKNNGDSICLKVPRQESLTVDSGLKVATQSKSTGNYDATFSTTNSNTYDLVKLPLLSTVELDVTYTLASLNTALGIVSTNSYSIAIEDVTNRPYLKSNSTQLEVAGSKILASIADGPDFEVSSMLIDSLAISSLGLLVDGDNLPSDYNSADPLDITFKYKLSGSSAVDIAIVQDAGLVVFSDLDNSYVYIPVVTKTANSIELLAGKYSIPLTYFSDILDAASEGDIVSAIMTEKGVNWGLSIGSHIPFNIVLTGSGVYSADYYNKDLYGYKLNVNLLARCRLSDISISTKVAPTTSGDTPYIRMACSATSPTIVYAPIETNTTSSIIPRALAVNISGVLGTPLINFDLAEGTSDSGTRGTSIGQISYGVNLDAGHRIVISGTVTLTL